MCGLVGIAGSSLAYAQRDLFRSMLIVDSLRGIHGTGVASVGPTNDVDWVKRSGNVYDLIDGKYFDRVTGVTGTDKKVLLGHNRHATFGAHNNDNAHPFDFRNVVGMHNGTVNATARRAMYQYDKYDTDSEAIYSNIDQGIKDGASWSQSIIDTVGKLEGAWALVMWIKKANKLVFVRNKERPLFYVYAEERKYLLWASEAWLLYGLANRHNLKLDDKVSSTTEDTIYSWDVPIAGGRFSDPNRLACKGKEIPVYTAPKHHGMWTPGEDYGDFAHGYTGAVPMERKTLPAPSTSVARTQLPTQMQTQHLGTRRFPNENNRKETNFRPPYKDHRGNVLTKPLFTEQIKLGGTCCYCNSHTPVWGEEVCFLRPSPVGSPQFACKQCVHDEEVMEILKGCR